MIDVAVVQAVDELK